MSYFIDDIGYYENVGQLRNGLNDVVAQTVKNDLHASFDNQYKKGDPYRAADFFCEHCPERWEKVKNWNSPGVERQCIYAPLETTLLALSVLYLLAENQTVCSSIEKIVQDGKIAHLEPVRDYFENSAAATAVLNGVGSQAEENKLSEGKRKLENDRAMGVEFNPTGTELLRYPADRTDSFYEIPYGVTKIADNAFRHRTHLTRIIIAESVNEIGSGTFSGCRALTAITLPDSVTKIDEGAFADCISLTAFSVPAQVADMGESIFFGCKGLTDIRINGPITEIPPLTFSKCDSLKKVTIPDCAVKIGERAFEGCIKLTGLSLPDGMNEIGNGAFSGCKMLEDINFPASMKTIGEGAFYGCGSLKQISISDSAGITEIKPFTFNECSSLKRAVMPEGLVKIGNDAFGGCSCLADINIPAGVTEIGPSAFAGCSSLTDMIIPSGVVIISTRMFFDCWMLKNVHIANNQAVIGQDAFKCCHALSNETKSRISELKKNTGTEEEIRKGQKDIAYLKDHWDVRFSKDNTVLLHFGSDFPDIFDYDAPPGILEIPYGVREIGENAFENCFWLKKVIIPDSVKKIASEAFYNCRGLSDVTIGHRVDISSSSFEKCPNLSESSKRILRFFGYQGRF